MTLIKQDDWLPQGVDSLEDRAWEALRETTRSVCVTAGAGAGKTEFLAQKATYLLQTGLCPHPKRILAISFKRDAAQTLAQRVEKRCPEHQARRFVSRTFDAFTKGLVDQFRSALPKQFRPPADYEISFPTAAILNDFLQRADINDVNAQTLTKWIEMRRLLDPTQVVSARQKEIMDAYWQDQYHGGTHAYLTFAMMNRLAEYLLRTNSRIRRAIRMTYPIVFLDEFQDATSAQFEIITAAFDPATAKLTAVGDDKQKIMGWAGAMPNAFAAFTAKYTARCISLLLNWRSHEDLVAIQHIIASQIDPNVEPVEARAEREVDGDVAAIWIYSDKEDEVAGLAGWVSDEIESGTVQAHDIAILVRNYADAVEAELREEFADRGVAIRNLARNVGDIAIQDLLTESLTALLMPFLRLGAAKKDAEAWSTAQDELRSLESISDDQDVLLNRLSMKVEEVAKACRAFMAANAAAKGYGGQLTTLIVDMIGEDNIRQANPSYQRQADFDRVREGLVALLDESLTDAESWPDALDRFEGKNQVPLMTIHKSKGMEFHTIIFFGLDNQSWWSLTPNRAEELNSFFVAFTRAKQRVFFTRCAQRGGHIAWLDKVLGDTVPRVDGPIARPDGDA